MELRDSSTSFSTLNKVTYVKPYLTGEARCSGELRDSSTSVCTFKQGNILLTLFCTGEAMSSSLLPFKKAFSNPLWNCRGETYCLGFYNALVRQLM